MGVRASDAARGGRISAGTARHQPDLNAAPGLPLRPGARLATTVHIPLGPHGSRWQAIAEAGYKSDVRSPHTDERSQVATSYSSIENSARTDPQNVSTSRWQRLWITHHAEETSPPMRLPSICHIASVALAFTLVSACGSNTAHTPTSASASIDHAAPPTAVVSLRGAVAQLSGTCPAVTFTINGTSVTTSSSTAFSDGSCAALANATSVSVTGRLQQGTLVATSVRTLPPPAVRVRGSVSGLAGTCPTLSFVVDGHAIATTAATRFGGGTCADVANGIVAEVDGTAQTTSIAASFVRLSIPVVEVSGTISALAGTCPAITMTVNGTAIAATAGTRFVGATCAQLANGLRVIVEASRTAGGAVTARRIIARR